jgi:hypothetical protein
MDARLLLTVCSNQELCTSYLALVTTASQAIELWIPCTAIAITSSITCSKQLYVQAMHEQLAQDSTYSNSACTQHSAVPYLASLCVRGPSTAQLQCAALALISAAMTAK